MEQTYLIYMGILVFSVLISTGMLVRLWQLRQHPGSHGLIAGVFFVALWSLAYILEIGSLNIADKIFWAKVQFIGIPFAPMGLFIFSLYYSGRAASLTRPRIFLLLLPGLLTTGLAFSNPAHKLIWREINLTNGLAFGPLALEHGIGFYIIAAYLYILILLSTVFLFQVALHANQLYRNQARIMLAGMMIPWVANFLYIAGINPAASLDLTPVAFTLTNLALSVAFTRYHLVDIQPVAHTALFRAMSDGILVLDKKERIIDINPAAQHILGINPEAIGNPVQGILPEWETWKIQDGLEQTARQLSLGEERTYEVRFTPIQGANGRPGGLLLVLADISTLKQANEEMRTASQLKTQLLANVSHDFRSPLGAIIGYAEMLKTEMFGPINEEQKNASAEILDSANQLLAFANNLIGQAQVETGKIVLRERPFAPSEITESILATLHFHALKKNLQFSQSIDENLPDQILGDLYWLRQIVINLLNNAVKFTTEGCVNLAFRSINAEEWAIEVSDSGIGISVEDQALIFEAFQQSDDPLARKQYGSGLGLSIVRELTRLMQGRIELESSPGGGSTFRVILPLKRPE
ncbi:MAG: histidine kinase N-terminal 7TM domain-containing protein [Anaerolineales bacterium]|jgi:PAS domain S-box-containing protein|nr:histidine kinase N-terminal 7TM domain-containing protein [Anaerolineales bacterium]